MLKMPGHVVQDQKIARQIPLSRILDAIEYTPPPPTPGVLRPLSQSGPMSPSLGSNDPGSLQGTFGSPHAGAADNASPSIGGPGAVGAAGAASALENCFKIITPKRTYLVCAPTEEDEIKWLAALQYLVSRRQTSTTTPAGSAGSTHPHTPAAQPTSTSVPPAAAASTSPPPATSQPGSRPGSSSAASPRKAAPPPPVKHGRQRSVTDAARAAVSEVERRLQLGRVGAARG